MTADGESIYALAQKLFPITRSITGDGVRQTHDILREVVPELVTHEVPTGTRAFDWVVPEEWNVEAAYIETTDGRRVVDFAQNNLHLVSYSTPVDQIVASEVLFEHLHSRPDLPDAIPYVTSYFNARWGFCVTQRQREALTDPEYRVVVRSTLQPGSLTYGEILVPGETEDEILLHTYTCHPSMGNNETSGMAVTAFLARSVLDMPSRRNSYRIVFVPETIGAVVYISRHLDELRRRVKAGFILTCVGDDRAWSLLPGRRDGALPERVAHHVLSNMLNVPYRSYTYLDRGSDERQYCAPGVDLPVVSIMRSKYAEYPEYHTSLDDLSVISPAGLEGGYRATRLAIEVLEANETLVATTLCEPWLAPRGLRAPLVDGAVFERWSALVSHVLAYADGEHDLLAIADIVGCSVLDLVPVASALKEQGLLAAS